MRYFRAASPEVYEAARASFDAVYGYPKESTKTVSSISPAIAQPIDLAGRVYLIASDAECEYAAVVDLLPQLLASGLVEEVDLQEFLSQIPGPL